MAEVSLKIKAQFAKAKEQFDKLDMSSESFQKSLKKLQAQMTNGSIDKFMQKNKLAATAMTASKGAAAGLNREMTGLQREMQRLITKGIDPLDPALNKMKMRMTQLEKQVPKTASKMGTAFKSLAGYFSIFAAFRIANSAIDSWHRQETAIKNVEAGLVSTKNAIGLTSKEFQKMASESQKVGIFGDEDILQNVTAQFLTFGNIGASNFDRIQKAALDVSAKLKGVNATSEDLRATSVMMGKAMDDPVRGMGAMRRVGIAFSADEEKAIKAMVKHNDTIGAQNLMLQAIEKQYGGTNKALSETSAGMEIAAKNNLGDMMEQLGKAIAPVRRALIETGLVLVKAVTPAFAILGPALSLVASILPELTAAFAAYIVVTKGAAMVTGLMTAAQAILNAVMLLNPIGLVVAAVAALVVAGIALYKNWDVVSVKMQGIWDGMKVAGQVGWEYIKISALTAIKYIIKGLMLINKPFIFVIDNIIKAFNKLTGKSIPTMTKSIGKFTGVLDKQIAKSNTKIGSLHKKRMTQLAEQTKMEKATSATSTALNKKAIEEAEKKAAVQSSGGGAGGGKSEAQSLQDNLNAMALSQEAFEQKRMNTIQSFFDQRVALQGIMNEQEMAAYSEQERKKIELSNMTDEQKKAAMAALDASIQKHHKANSINYTAFTQQMLGTTGGMLTDLQTVFKNAGKESKALAVTMKIVSAAQAAIASYLAFTETLAAPMLVAAFPANIIGAGVVLAAGLAKQAAILSTPISGQTGLSNYTVPDVASNRNDKAPVMAQGGETVSITPRGEEDSKTTEINISIAEQVIFSTVTKGIKNGQINVNANNIGRGVFAN